MGRFWGKSLYENKEKRQGMVFYLEFGSMLPFCLILSFEDSNFCPSHGSISIKLATELRISTLENAGYASDITSS